MNLLRRYVTWRNARAWGGCLVYWLSVFLTMHIVNLLEPIAGWPWWASMIPGIMVALYLASQGKGFSYFPQFKEPEEDRVDDYLD